MKSIFSDPSLNQTQKSMSQTDKTSINHSTEHQCTRIDISKNTALDVVSFKKKQVGNLGRTLVLDMVQLYKDFKNKVAKSPPRPVFQNQFLKDNLPELATNLYQLLDPEYKPDQEEEEWTDASTQNQKIYQKMQLQEQLIKQLKPIWKLITPSCIAFQKEQIFKKVRVIGDHDLQIIQSQKYKFKDHIREKMYSTLQEESFWQKEDYLECGKLYNQQQESKFYLQLKKNTSGFLPYAKKYGKYMRKSTQKNQSQAKIKDEPIIDQKQYMLLRLGANNMMENICQMLRILSAACSGEIQNFRLSRTQSEYTHTVKWKKRPIVVIYYVAGSDATFEKFDENFKLFKPFLKAIFSLERAVLNLIGMYQLYNNRKDKILALIKQLGQRDLKRTAVLKENFDETEKMQKNCMGGPIGNQHQQIYEANQHKQHSEQS